MTFSNILSDLYRLDLAATAAVFNSIGPVHLRNLSASPSPPRPSPPTPLPPHTHTHLPFLYLYLSALLIHTMMLLTVLYRVAFWGAKSAGRSGKVFPFLPTGYSGSSLDPPPSSLPTMVWF